MFNFWWNRDKEIQSLAEIIAIDMAKLNLSKLAVEKAVSMIAMEVGRIFYVEKEVLAYQELGIGRLIHQLPESLCEMFLKEVFDEQEENIFDEEILSTVNQFFENNLNISETARQLYVHRNTLVHRLERIQKLTGLDVRMFEDALTLKIALMVSDQVKYTKLKNRK